MVMHKLVNGVRVELTPEEEAARIAESEFFRKKHEEERKIKQEKDSLYKSAMDKLLSTLTPEEQVVVRERLPR